MERAHTGDQRETESRDALQTALAAYFAVRHLESRSTAYLYGGAMPSLALCVNAWRALPGLVTWFAMVGWAACLFVTLAFLAIAAIRRAQIAHVLPEANRQAHVHFAGSANIVVRSSTILIWLAAAASALLWLHALFPALLRPEVVDASAKTWIVLLTGALANRYVEAS